MTSKLAFDIVQIISHIVPALGRERAEAAAKITITATLRVIDRALPGQQIEARAHAVRNCFGTEHIKCDRAELFDIPMRRIIERGSARQWQISNCRPTGYDDAIRPLGTHGSRWP